MTSSVKAFDVGTHKLVVGTVRVSFPLAPFSHRIHKDLVPFTDVSGAAHGGWLPALKVQTMCVGSSLCGM